MGLDPGLRTGVKVAVVDATGKVMETATIYPHQPRNDWDGSLHALEKLAEKYSVSLISIGNGTASRETDKLAQGPDQAAPRTQADCDRGIGSGRLGLFRVRIRFARTARAWMSRCAARFPSRAGCRTRWRNW